MRWPWQRERPEQRDHAVASESEEREGVVALVGIECAAGAKARQPERGREHQQRPEDDPIVREDAAGAKAHSGAALRWPELETSKASGGNGSSASPATSARARARLIAS